MASDRGDAAGYLGWFLFGAVVGGMTAIFATPRTGREAREFLAERGSEWARRAQDLASEAQSLAGEWLDKGRDLFEEQAQRLGNAFQAGRDAMRDEISRGPGPERV